MRHQQRSSRSQLQQEARPQTEQQHSRLRQQPPWSAIMMSLLPVDQVNVLHGYPSRISVPIIIHPHTSPYFTANAGDTRTQPPTIPQCYSPDTVRTTPRHQMHPILITQNSLTSGQNTHSSSASPMSPVSPCSKQVGVRVLVRYIRVGNTADPSATQLSILFPISVPHRYRYSPRLFCFRRHCH
jgi:hypothetical protein